MIGTYYSNFKGWAEETIKEIQRICDYISKYSEERGWRLYLVNLTRVILSFDVSPPEVKEKFGDRRILELKSYYGRSKTRR